MEQPMKSTCSSSTCSSSSPSSPSSSSSSSSSSRWYSSNNNSSSSRARSCQRCTSSSSSTSMLFMFLLLMLLLPIGAYCRRLGPVRLHSAHSTGSQTKKTTRTLSTRILQHQERVALKPKNHQNGGDESRRDLNGLGSSPPQCNSKCGYCSPCRAVHVPIQPGLIRTTEYYPEAWRCKCGNKLYMP